MENKEILDKMERQTQQVEVEELKRQLQLHTQRQFPHNTCTQVEELNRRLSWTEEHLLNERIMRLQAVNQKKEQEKLLKTERSLKYKHKKEEQRLREKLEKAEKSKLHLLEQELEAERRLHAERVTKDLETREQLKAEREALQQEMEEAIKLLKKEALEKETVFKDQLEQLNRRLSLTEEHLLNERIMRLQAVKQKNEQEKLFKTERSLKHQHKKEEQRLRKKLEKLMQPCDESSNKLQVPSELQDRKRKKDLKKDTGVTKDLELIERLKAEREEAIKPLKKDALEKEEVFKEQMKLQLIDQVLQKKLAELKEVLELEICELCVMCEEFLLDPQTLKVQEDVPREERERQLRNSERFPHASPAGRTTTQSKSWADYDEEDERRVYEEEDPASLFRDDEAPANHRYPLDDLRDLFQSATERMESPLPPQPPTIPSRDFTAGLLAKLSKLKEVLEVGMCELCVMCKESLHDPPTLKVQEDVPESPEGKHFSEEMENKELLDKLERQAQQAESLRREVEELKRQLQLHTQRQFPHNTCIQVEELNRRLSLTEEQLEQLKLQLEEKTSSCLQLTDKVKAEQEKNQVLQMELTKLKEVLEVNMCELCVMREESLPDPPTLKVQKDVPLEDREQRLRYSERSPRASPAPAARRTMTQSKSWADYDEEDDRRVYEEEDPASLFTDDEAPANPLDDLLQSDSLFGPNVRGTIERLETTRKASEQLGSHLRPQLPPPRQQRQQQ